MTTSCGHESGYTMHRRRGEKACTLCKAAHSTYNRKRYGIRHRAGTAEGIAHHRTTGSPICDRCLDWAIYVESNNAWRGLPQPRRWAA